MCCKLEQLVNTICKEAGGTMVNSFDFLYRGDYLSLGWVGDVMPLTKMYGELSNHMMDWIRAWLNPQIEDTKSYVCSPYLVSLLRSHVRDKNSSVEVYMDFLLDKYTALPGLDVRTLIVPYTCGRHWSVYVLGDRGFFHFDSMARYGLHSDVIIRTSLAKMWTVRSGYAESSDRWLQSSHVHKWIKPYVPEQNSGWGLWFLCLEEHDGVHQGSET